MIVAVVPARNEAKRLGQVITELKTAVDRVVVVDDGSVDDTALVAAAEGAVVLRQLINRGQGAALRTGSRWAIEAGAEIIVHFDADGQFLVSDLPGLIEPLKNGQAEIVFGSRFLRTGNQLPPLKRYWILPLAKIFNKVFLKINLSDPQSGLRAFRSEIFDKIIWGEDRMAHCSEIMNLAHRQKLKIAEAPMSVVYHEYGQGFGGGLKILKDLVINKLNR